MNWREGSVVSFAPLLGGSRRRLPLQKGREDMYVTLRFGGARWGHGAKVLSHVLDLTCGYALAIIKCQSA